VRAAALAALAALLGGLSSEAGAQATTRARSAERLVTVARQLRAGDSLRVRVNHAAGPLLIAAADSNLLYEVAIRYDPARGTLLRRWDEGRRTLSVGVDSAKSEFHWRVWEGGVPHDAKEHPSSLTLSLGRGVPLDLSLDYGASKAVLDLSGLTVERLAMRVGASETRLLFGTANPTRMRELRIACIAGSLTIAKLGNANAHRVEIRGIAAGVDLDLSGAWEHDMEIDADFIMAGLTLRVPDDVGVRVVARREVLGSVEAPGLRSRENGLYSANWESATRKLTVTASAILGGVTLARP
jgi:hypothetical protein